MRRRHLPRTWLMTDERMGEGLWPALQRLPAGSGIIFRHYTLPPAERQHLFRQVSRVARARRLVLVRAGPRHLGREDGVHGHLGRGLRTASAHSRREAVRAMRRGAQLLFVSPVFSTQSHPGAAALGRVRFGLLIHRLDTPVIALGGMTPQRFASLRGMKVHGWAAIDAWR
jgi:thiamine-phosphate pyrophosphorylase